jgi:predicted LPLAT superfamily acyltransferase
MPRWQGKSKGTPLGYRIFVFVCKTFGLGAAYLLLRFVAFYYFVFSTDSSKAIYNYFKHRLGYGTMKSIVSIYKNYYLLGQTLIDKRAVFAGIKNQFTYHFDGIENLKQMVGRGKGGILLSAHVGNWEMAGHHLQHLNTKINVVMFDGEHEKVKNYLEGLGEKSFKAIVIKQDMSHVYEMGAALANNELVCMHADRFLEGNKTMSMNLLGEEALFPAGPFQMAAGFNVPVSMVYAFKETTHHYHYFGSSPIDRNEGEKKADFALRLAYLYVQDLENKIKQYPIQWFNYYDFWKN